MLFSVNTFKKILEGQSILRIMMNEALKGYSLFGSVVDIGGARQSYLPYMDIAPDTTIVNTDMRRGDNYIPINFETDPLPFESNTVDCVLAFNIFEHIYNYNFLAEEVCRITKKGGKLKGFVPFWMKYHPDPHDFFRYTGESLKRIFMDAGYSSVVVEEIGGSIPLANCNTVILVFPRILRPLVFVPYFLLDILFLYVRPESRKRTPLGYMFTAIK